MSLVTYEDLAATNAAGVTVAQRSLDRMMGNGAQMPPVPAAAPPTTEIATFQAWIATGLATGTSSGDCSGGGGPLDGPATCTSGTTWTRGNHESPLMHPGLACIDCHVSDEGPRFRIAGTVYPTGHEPNDCNGAPSASVEVVDARGTVTTLSVNAAGNFYSSAAITFPIHVAVVKDGMRRAMAGAPPSGDCNTCHTQNGSQGAPGRIALP